MLDELNFHDDEHDTHHDDDAWRDVPFVPSDDKIVAAMLELGQVNVADRLYDLGCGDGRIVIAAALEYGARGVGIDIDPQLLEEAREIAEWSGLAEHVLFVEDNLFDADFSDATVVMLYLLQSVNVDLRPRLLAELQPGTRIVSHSFNMGPWRPDESSSVSGIHLYKWIVPAAVAGSWVWKDSDGASCRVKLKQQFQDISGKAWVNDRPAALEATLLGSELTVSLRDNEMARTFTFRHDGDAGLLPTGSTDAGITARRLEDDST